MQIADVVSFLALVQGLVLGVVILLAHRKDRPTRLLAAFVIMLSLRILPYYFNRQPDAAEYPELLWLPFYFFYPLLPALYLHAKQATGLLNWRKDWVHMLPGAIEMKVIGTMGLITLVISRPLVSMPVAINIIGTLGIVATAVVALYVYWLMNLLTQHRDRILEYYSDSSNKKLGWIRNTAVAFLFLAMLYPFLRFGPFPAPMPVVILFGASCNALLIFYVTVSGIRQLGLTPLWTVQRSDESRSTASCADDAAEDYQSGFEVVERHLLQTEAYLDPNLTLSDLSTRVAISDRSLSRIINSGSGMNFNSYINHFRVKKAKNILVDPGFSHYNMEGIAGEAGFNSRTTFYEAFRRETGQSPAMYRRNRGTSTAS